MTLEAEVKEASSGKLNVPSVHIKLVLRVFKWHKWA